MKRFVCVLIIFMFIPTFVYAEDFDSEKYNEMLSNYDFSIFEDKLDKDTYNILEELGIAEFDYYSISSLSINDVITIIKSIVSSRFKGSLSSLSIILAFIILSSLFHSMNIDTNDNYSSVYSLIASALISVTITMKISNTLSISVMTLKVASDFVFAFVPVFCGIVIASGGVNVAFSTNSMLLTLSQALSYISSNIFMPLINSFFSRWYL